MTLRYAADGRWSDHARNPSLEVHPIRLRGRRLLAHTHCHKV